MHSKTFLTTLIHFIQKCKNIVKTQGALQNEILNQRVKLPCNQTRNDIQNGQGQDIQMISSETQELFTRVVFFLFSPSFRTIPSKEYGNEKWLHLVNKQSITDVSNVNYEHYNDLNEGVGKGSDKPNSKSISTAALAFSSVLSIHFFATGRIQKGNQINKEESYPNLMSKL